MRKKAEALKVEQLKKQRIALINSQKFKSLKFSRKLTARIEAPRRIGPLVFSANPDFFISFSNVS